MSEISQEDRLAALLLRWEESWELGDDLPASQLCTDCPNMADQLQANIDVLKKMAWMKRDAANEVQSDGDDAVADSFVGKTLAGRYRIDQFIGEGGFGQVYRAFDAELQRPVALKIARHEAQAGSDDLLQEARRVAKLRHAGIVAVHDVGHDEQILFVVSDFIEGQSLAQLLEAKPPDPWEAAKLVARIAEALHFAHEQGFVHRDIKPANILIDKQGQPLIADFGIAATSEELTQGTHLSSGTLPYMAPEQVAGEVQLVDGRTDVYALGVVLYEILSGRSPHEARTPTALREQILFRAPLHLDAPAELQQVCLRCLAKHPADRFPTAQALAKALRQAVTRKAHAQRWRVTLIVLLLAVLAIATVVGIRFLPSLLESRTGTFVKEGAFVFDGTNRIVTPVERFAPVTLEAWIRPERYEYRCQCVVGSDIPTEYGIGLGISEQDGVHRESSRSQEKEQNGTSKIDSGQLIRSPLTVDVVVNNAGFGAMSTVANLPLERQLQMIQVNVAALTHLTRSFLPGMIQRKRGGILNVGSTAGFQPGPNMAVYYASKAFVLSFTEALAEELIGSGVHVTCLAPGATATGFRTAAHMEDALLFRLGTVDAKTVASLGYRGFRRGRVIVIPGLKNKLGAFAVRLGPRFFVRKLVKRLQG